MQNLGNLKMLGLLCLLFCMKWLMFNLGGRVVTTFKDCSVLVTDRIRRTVKFLCCVGLGLPIVGPQWLAKCRSSGKFVGKLLRCIVACCDETVDRDLLSVYKILGCTYCVIKRVKKSSTSNFRPV